MNSVIKILEDLFMINVISGVLMVPAMAAESSSTGSFNLGNAPPVITQLNITGNPTTLDPYTEYTMEITVSDMNSLSDLKEITFFPRYNGTHIGPWYRWINGTWSDVYHAMDWPLGGSTIPELNNTVGTFYVNFTISKVANEDTNGNWGFLVSAFDYYSSDTEQLNGFNMNWRGELTSQNSSFDFGNIALNDRSKKITVPADGNIDFTVIANGNYSLESKSTNWTRGNISATLVSTANLGFAEFNLENDGTNTIGNSTFVSDIYTGIEDNVELTGPTSVQGVTKQIYTWISVADAGLLPGIYSGIYYAQIVNG